CETPNLSLGEKLQSRSTVSMQSCRIKATFPNVVTFQFPYKSDSVQVPVVVTAKEVGAKPIDNNIPTNLLTPGLGLKPGDVTFKYKGYNEIVCNTEVVLDYFCPFCYLACASYKGLKCHLQASHDLFDYEFQEEEEYKVVNVSYNKTNAFSPQVEKKFFFCHKALTRTKLEDDQTQLADHLGHVTLG
nr:hypothetical protein [Tanacetum cinerariifolium]